MVAADGLPMQEASLSIAVVLALYSQYITAHKKVMTKYLKMINQYSWRYHTLYSTDI